MKTQKVTVKQVNIGDLRNDALRVIQDAITGKREPDSRSQLSIKALNLIQRQEQLAASNERSRLRLIHRVMTPEELRKYVLVSQPEIKRLVG